MGILLYESVYRSIDRSIALFGSVARSIAGWIDHSFDHFSLFKEFCFLKSLHSLLKSCLEETRGAIWEIPESNSSDVVCIVCCVFHWPFELGTSDCRPVFQIWKSSNVVSVFIREFIPDQIAGTRGQSEFTISKIWSPEMKTENACDKQPRYF